MNVETEVKNTKTIFTIRVNYKSGKTEEFECYEFSCIPGKEASWEGVAFPAPLWLGLENVESIWQVSVREVDVDA